MYTTKTEILIIQLCNAICNKVTSLSKPIYIFILLYLFFTCANLENYTITGSLNPRSNWVEFMSAN